MISLNCCFFIFIILFISLSVIFYLALLGILLEFTIGDSAKAAYTNAPVPLQEDFRGQNFEGVAPETIEPLPFNDSGREAGIAALYGQGPKFGTTNRRYENEYRDFLASQSDTMRQFGPITYEEFADAYERMYQGKPQIGFR